jgi:glycosyltransferase involved in cell wall biosynthesis
MSVCFVAAPLTARSGVYRSARELVAAGRELGLDWRLLMGVSSEAAGTFPLDDPEWIDEFPFEPSGLGGVLALRTRLRRHPLFDTAGMIISLIPQTDMALSTMVKPWIAFLRGQPWPEPGETGAAKRKIWKSLEKAALRRADEIWATTQILSNYAELPRISIVPAGVRPVPRTWDGRGERDRAVWAARYNHDKNPALFLQTLKGMPLEGVMHGSGPLLDELRAAAPENVRVAGWVAATELWTDALAYLGTSHREAFGRSALEAAMNGVPVVLAESFGVAPLLVTDPVFRSRFVLPASDVGRWRAALEALRQDENLRVAYSEHLVENAVKLTIAASAKAVAARLR